ncbi:putative holin-like toxin [Paenibacillus thiaminolyticus]|uniref:Holin-like toxin n=1 Tax=Paenibacillus thiaminolyticus TaxID=49283 RepID=A0ABT4FYK1_PANTH|nr:putative holin-like toxin [Paenibacillus thiaminolyticus]MCY9536829.1 putative holin-like toxin [Paenibacillus thiaminolyticus]MCY9603955.1 putative holin-like toxin [Paenibacillus thiaminolyticus]MCY9609219.1 putative holin-like toxin [Paenibacillus thiaminolyticus]MCY9612305.1 putative holin-like toxin [Paenibacillus thiaminolyticus]MCY9621707.1 putative holin-like toxin [Paenibacillus thiaminolyticus]
MIAFGLFVIALLSFSNKK